MNPLSLILCFVTSVSITQCKTMNCRWTWPSMVGSLGHWY